MKRKIYNELLKWKNTNHSQSLLVKGARQVGKTFIIKEFGKNEFENMLYINFEDQMDIRDSFDGMANPDEAVKTLQAYGVSKNVFTIEKEKTLIFLDEIQLSKRAYSLLKPLTEMDRFKIVASGSLLGVNLGGTNLDPGPTVKHLKMHPMDFEEFLLAIFEDGFKDIIVNVKKDAKLGKLTNEAYHSLLNKSIKEYIIVGGMPQVVLSYKKNKDYGEVYIKQEEIVNLYRSDIQQYQTYQDNKIKTLKCFDSIPKQFSKENHRFQYSIVEKGKKGRYFGNSIDWLERTGNVKKCYNTNHLSGSLIDGKGTSFKLFMNDIGLLVNMLGKQYIYKIQNDELGMFKGALWEQLLAQMLNAKSQDLYYIRLGDYEIDFLIQDKVNILPLECKSGGNTKSKSLKSYIDKYKPIKAFKISMNNINISNDITKAIPHYVFALLSYDEIVNL